MGKLTLLSKGDRRFYKDGIKKVKYDAKTLAELSDVEFTDDMDPKDRLRTMVKILDGMLPIAHGLFKASPRASTAYAVNAVMDRMQSILEQLETGLDLSETAKDLVKEVVEPILDQLILELGKTIRTEYKQILPYLDTKAKKKLKKANDTIYLKFASLIKDKHTALKNGMENHFKKIK